MQLNSKVLKRLLQTEIGRIKKRKKKGWSKHTDHTLKYSLSKTLLVIVLLQMQSRTR